MDNLSSRAETMANAFFKKRDQELLEQLRAEISKEEQRDALAKVCGIDDIETLNRLVAVGIDPESLAAVAMIPLVAVAWADRDMATQERAAILKAADEAGIGAGTAAYAMLEAWLNEKPGKDLIDSWVAYVGAVHEKLDAPSASGLKNGVLNRAKQVAQAAGGYLGVGAISAAESQVIADVESAFRA